MERTLERPSSRANAGSGPGTSPFSSVGDRNYQVHTVRRAHAERTLCGEGVMSRDD